MILKNDTTKENINDFLLEYPPILSTIYPPTKRPQVGEVRHTVENPYKRFFSSSTPRAINI